MADYKVISILKHKWRKSEGIFFCFIEDGVKCWQPLEYLRKTEPKITRRYMKANKENFPEY